MAAGGVSPQGPWRTTTLAAGLRQGGIIAPLVLDGPMTGAAFRAYVEQFLAPRSPLKKSWCSTSSPRTMSPAAARRSRRQAPRSSTCRRTRPTSRLAPSTDHRGRCGSGAPIEQLFAKLKALLLEAAARSRDDLWSTIGRLLATIPPDECARYFHHCEYAYLR
jgi:hypothetical protein